MAEENHDPQYVDKSGDNKDQQTNSDVTEQNKQNQQDQNTDTNNQNTDSVDKKEEQVEDKSSNESTSALLNFVEQAGFDTEMVDAYLDQNGTIPDSLYEKLVEQHGEAIANMIKSNIESAYTDYAAKQKEQDKKLYSHLEEAFKGITDQDGEKTWNELKTWAGENLKDQKDEINAMLSQGGMQAQLALDYIVNQFKASEDFTQPANLTDGDDFASDFQAAPLSKQGYNEELNKLLGKGFSYDSVEVQQLQRRRMKSMRRGH